MSLYPGLYEQVINNDLTHELAQYLADVVQKGLDNVLDNGGDISA